MKSIGRLVIVAAILAALGLLGNRLVADSQSRPYAESTTWLAENPPYSTTGLINEEPAATNTPAPPAGGSTLILTDRRADDPAVEARAVSQPRTSIRQLHREAGVQSAQGFRRAEPLHHGIVRFELPERRISAPTSGPSSSAPDERCVQVLKNPELHVVEFGDGTGSIEHWVVLYQMVYYDDHNYVSPHHSLVLDDEPVGEYTDIDDFWGTGLDYDMFGQGFWTPPDMTRIVVLFSSRYLDWNSDDMAWVNLVSLPEDGYLQPENFEAVVEIPTKGEATWEHWAWELTADDDPQWMDAMSDRPMAVIFDHLSDRQAPYQTIWLDDVYVFLCFQWEAPPSAIYLPALHMEPLVDPGPRCNPREPDSIDSPGFTTVDATCSASFTALDQRDYYTLDLRGARDVQLQLFDLPSGTNWDALIYQNTAGYPLACHIGTPGAAPKEADCTLDPTKSYFVMVNRGPGTTGGSYKMQVERR